KWRRDDRMELEPWSPLSQSAGTAQATQSARNTFISRGDVALRLPQNTSCLPSRESIGNDANDSAYVTRSRPAPSALTRYSANERPPGSWRFDENTICSPGGTMNGAKFAAPFRVTWRSPVPSARIT